MMEMAARMRAWYGRSSERRRRNRRRKWRGGGGGGDVEGGGGACRRVVREKDGDGSAMSMAASSVVGALLRMDEASRRGEYGMEGLPVHVLVMSSAR